MWGAVSWGVGVWLHLPPKALCATGPALVHRATHHQCIAAPVVGVWVPPHGMQPCVADRDVLRCVPPLQRSHCTRGPGESASRRPKELHTATVVELTSVCARSTRPSICGQLWHACGRNDYSRPTPCVHKGWGWGSLRAPWITAEGPTKRRSSLRKIELEQRPAAPPAPVQRFR